MTIVCMFQLNLIRNVFWLSINRSIRRLLRLNPQKFLCAILKSLKISYFCFGRTSKSTRYAGWLSLNPLTAGAAYIRVFIFYYHIKYHILNMLKKKCDINQQDLISVDLHFVKSE